MTGDISYKTHILVGVRPSGMSVLADWPYVPKQSEVQREIDRAKNGYVTFLLCTPTSILPASSADGASKSGPWGPGGRGNQPLALLPSGSGAAVRSRPDRYQILEVVCSLQSSALASARPHRLVSEA